MRRLRVWFLRLAGLFNKERRERELEEEIESHLRLHIQDNLQSGMTPEEARRDADKAEWAALWSVTPDYFRTLGIPILQGRSFGEQDAKRAPEVAIINEGLARKYWPNGDATGKRILFGDTGPTVVGVASGMTPAIGTASAREVPIIGFTVDTTIAPENTTRPTDNIGRASDTEAIIKGDTGKAIGRDVQAGLREAGRILRPGLRTTRPRLC